MQKRALLACLVSSFLLTPQALAQQNTLQQSPLQKCAAIEDSLQRLVCYDNLAKQQASQQQENIKKERAKQKDKKNNHGQRVAEQARQKGQQMRNKDAQQTEQRFGLEHKNIEENNGLDKLVVEIASRREDPYGNWVITLKNDQVWKQTESVGYFSWPEDDTYYIERGAFNSFFFGREGTNRRFRVTRVK